MSAVFTVSQIAMVVPTVILFGRPGAGKTTIAKMAARSLNLEDEMVVLNLDLDHCVPQWMRDNFAKGIYPTPDQRLEFASAACDFVDKAVHDNFDRLHHRWLGVIIAFSFVNADMRDYFRSRFSHARWALVDTSFEETERRIHGREGHFYIGRGESSENEGKQTTSKSNAEESNDWDFAPVDYPHAVLNGEDSVEINSDRVVNIFNKAIREMVDANH